MKAPAGSANVESAAKKPSAMKSERAAAAAPAKSIKAAKKTVEVEPSAKPVAVAADRRSSPSVPAAKQVTPNAALSGMPVQTAVPSQPAGKPAAKSAESALPAVNMNQAVKTNAKPAEADEPVPIAETKAVSASAAAPGPVAAPAAGQPAHGARGPIHMLNGRPAPISRASNKDESFSQGDFVVYPTHGVGKVERIAVEDIAGHKLELIHITFEENRMTLRVPVSKARSAGLRRLATRKMFDEALAVLKGRARIKRTMWSRRAQEYEAKINSGDPIAIAEVVRDLHRNVGQPDQSFSERQIYEAAMDRLAAELAALDLTDKAAASAKLASFLKTV